MFVPPRSERSASDLEAASEVSWEGGGASMVIEERYRDMGITPRWRVPWAAGEGKMVRTTDMASGKIPRRAGGRRAG
jgi:hypothetical protein